MSAQYKYRSIFAAVAIAAGTLAPLPAFAGGYGYGYDEPSYQPHYYKPHYAPRCHYVYQNVYDDYLGYYVHKRVKVCDSY
jgi:hypothetical protein